MKFLGKGSIPDSRLLKLVLFFTLLYFTLLGVTNILVYVDTIGFSKKAIAEYYLGSEDGFREPATYRGLLEQAHFHLFSMAMGLLLVCHLTDFTGLPQWLKKLLIGSSFVSGLADQASGWLIRFVSAELAVLKAASFGVFAASFLAMSVISLVAVAIYPRRSRARLV